MERKRSPRATLDVLEWTETSRAWHAVATTNHRSRALCGTMARGYYAFPVMEYPSGPPALRYWTIGVCDTCAQRVRAMVDRIY